MGLDFEQYVERLVLNQICDDYENVDQTILPNVADSAGLDGRSVKRSDVVEALVRLIAKGLAKASLLNSRDPFSVAFEGMPSLEVEEDFRTYFYATRKGIDLQLSDDA